ncbi:hypothetical protein AZZ81_000363, partial [Klebsiella aerogenes]
PQRQPAARAKNGRTGGYPRPGTYRPPCRPERNGR